MRLITGLSARGRLAVAGTAAGALALAAGLAAFPSPGDEALSRDTRRSEGAAAPAPTTTSLPPTTAPTTKPARPAVAATTGTDTGTDTDSDGEAHCGCDDGTIAGGPLADGRHVVLMIGVDPEARTVALVEPAQPDQMQLMEDDPVHLMSVTPGYDLTGLAADPARPRYWATVEGGFVTLLEPRA